MADIIRLTASEVEALASKFSSAADETTTTVNNLQMEVSNAASGWEGDAYNAFAQTFEDIKKQMTSVHDMYEGINTMLLGVVKSLQEADSGLAGAIRGQG